MPEIPIEFIENPDNIDPYIIYRKARELGIFYPDLLEAQLEFLYPTKLNKSMNIGDKLEEWRKY